MVPLPKIDEIYACLRGSKVFSTLDMHSGYHHVEMTDEARPKTAFTLPTNLGKWEFLRCPFGLAQAPAYFQRLINEVLAPFDFAFGYLDDILIYSPDVNTHLHHLELVFQHLCEVDLKLKRENVASSRNIYRILVILFLVMVLNLFPKNCHPYNRCLTLILQRKLNNFWVLLVIIENLYLDMLILHDP